MSSTSSAAPCCASAARVTAPISFLSHQSFMSVIRRFPLLVATLIPLLFMTVTPSTVDAAVVSANVLASCPVLDCASGSTPRPNTFFPVHVASDVAQFWDSYYGQNFKIINVTGSGEQYVLYQCGTDRPAVGPVTVLSADYQNDGGIVERTQTVQILPNAKFFTIPLKKVCVYETVVMTFMEQLGVRTSIHKVAAKYTTSPCINQLVTENKIKQLKSYPIDPTEQTDCDAVIMYGNKASPDPKTITFLATTDTGSLNRAEYLDYLSLFFNKEAAANSVFPPIVKRYNALAEKAKAKTGKKKAAWISGFGSFDIDTAAYKVDLMASAGFDVLTLPAGSQTSFKNSADLLKVLRENNVEVFIDDAYAVKNFDAFLVYYNITGVDAVPETSNYLFIKHKQILRIDGLKSKNDAHDWFESAVPNMDAVLTDLVYRSYPDLVPSSWSRKWFRNIGLGEGTQIIVEECTDVSAATLPLLDETPGPAGYKCPEWLMNPSLYVNNTAPRTGGAVQANGIVHGVIAAIIVMGTMMQLFFH